MYIEMWLVSLMLCFLNEIRDFLTKFFFGASPYPNYPYYWISANTENKLSFYVTELQCDL